MKTCNFSLFEFEDAFISNGYCLNCIHEYDTSSQIPITFVHLQMAKKKRKNVGRPFFGAADPRNNRAGTASVELVFPTIYKRFDPTLVQHVQEHSNIKQLPGLNLRPARTVSRDYEQNTARCNDVVDLQKLDLFHAQCMKAHKLYAAAKRSTRHVPNLKLNKHSQQGFGVRAIYKCTRCTFVSEPCKLFDTTSSGACVTNIQASLAFSKSTIKPSDAEFFISTLNINGPSKNTFQKHFSAVNKESSQILESAMSDNRAVVHDYVALEVGPEKKSCPDIPVELDGQYDVQTHHGHDGKSSSVSEPVLEAKTGLDLLISHAVVSKHDGTYEKDKVRRKSFCHALPFGLLSFFLFFSLAILSSGLIFLVSCTYQAYQRLRRYSCTEILLHFP